ncbi:MAG: phosphonoacetaldehyde hydrolase [Succinatimonas sp.]|nr:phosphonoacetaldehyde hydrolase [Succinatimonas sp.]
MTSNNIQLVVFDWAGTTVDYGSSAPNHVFNKVFKAHGINLTNEQINAPMGMEKKSHIRTLLQLPEASEQFKKLNGRDFNENDVNELYLEFEETLFKVVAEYSTPIDGVVNTVESLKNKGIKIGSTTGYTSQMMEKVVKRANDLGYKPDCIVTPDVTGASRPTPFMLFECMRQMNVYPANKVVKVGDTIVDILEGKNAGAYSVGILQGSNLLGLSKEEYDHLDETTLKQKKEEARQKYFAAGADYVIDSITDLLPLIDSINAQNIQ